MGSSWTRLYEKATESEHLADVLDKDADAFALFFLMMAKAGVWGRFPANPKLLKARVAPLSDRLTAARIAEVLPILEEPPAGEVAGLVQRYTIDERGTTCLAITNHLVYNSRQQWHRVGAPEFPPPPGWQPPAALCVYLDKVRHGRYRDKEFAQECTRFGLCPDAILSGEAVAPPDEAPPLPQRKLPMDGETQEPVDETRSAEREASSPAPTPKPKREPRRRQAVDEQAADHSELYDALEAAYPNYRDARLRGLLAVYLGHLSQPGCTVSETQLVATLKREPPLAGSTPDRYMLHVQGMFRRSSADEEETPARPELSPERLAQIEQEQRAAVQAELQEARLQRLAEHGIPVEVDDWWQETQGRLRDRGSWSVGLSMCWLQSVAEGVATLLVPANVRPRVAPLEGEIVAALEETVGGSLTLDVRELVAANGYAPRAEPRRAEAIAQARAYLASCEAYGDDPEALADALKPMFGRDLAQAAAQAATSTIETSEDQDV